MKLSNDKFLEMLAYLGAYYYNFKFDLIDNETGQPTMMYDVWYEAFSSFNDNDFEMIVKSYCKSNSYPPSSPTNILDHGREYLMNKHNADEKFENVIKKVRASMWDLDRVFRFYMHDEQEKDLVVAKTIQSVVSEFQVWFNDSSQLPFLKIAFKKSYQENLKRQIENDIENGKITKIGLAKNNMIGVK